VLPPWKGDVLGP